MRALWLGGLATAQAGDVSIDASGQAVTKTKSDVLVHLRWRDGQTRSFGVSVKACNNKAPTNAQLYFTTARGFCALMRREGLAMSLSAEHALRQFCGDAGFRPIDETPPAPGRLSDPNRWYWEELPQQGRDDLERLFASHQASVTRTLLQAAYPDDPHRPVYVMHQRYRCVSQADCPLAILSVDQFVEQSSAFGGFSTRRHAIRKGTYKSDPGIHLAPRFGFVQFQRGGQKQHPTQLQFNLMAGYFNKLP